MISAGIGAVTGALSAAFPVAGVLIETLGSIIDSIAIDLITGEDAKTIVIDAVVAGSFGALIGSFDGSFATDPKAFNKMRSLFKTATTSSKATARNYAKKAIKQTTIKLVREFAKEVGSSLTYSAIEWYTQQSINRYFDFIKG